MRNVRGQQGEASRVKMSGSEKKYKLPRRQATKFLVSTYGNSSSSRAKRHCGRENNGKQLYKKGGLHVQICFFANRSIDFVAVLVTVAVQHCKILFYFLFIIKYLVNESFDFSPG